MARRPGKDDGPITIKKYANRRLYNTSSSSYITLDDLARMTRENVDFQVIDAKSGDDITHSILTQIIMEEEASGEQLLPISFLRDLITMYGNSMQSLMPPYLEAMMVNFRKNQSKLQDAFKQGLGSNPLARMAETNLAMMRAASDALMPRSQADRAAAPRDGKEEEIAELRRQLAAMQEKLDQLDK